MLKLNDILYCRLPYIFKDSVYIQKHSDSRIEIENRFGRIKDIFNDILPPYWMVSLSKSNNIIHLHELCP